MVHKLEVGEVVDVNLHFQDDDDSESIIEPDRVLIPNTCRVAA